MSAGPLTGTPATVDPPAPPPTVLDWLLVGLLCLLAGVLAVFGVFFLPTYVGSVPVPAVVLVLALALVVLPRLSYRLTGRIFASMAPVVVWFAVSVGLYLTTNALFRSPVAWRGWQFSLLIGVGAIAAATSIGLLWGEQLGAEMAARIGPETRRRR